jgi:hypothetical protein
MPIALSCLGKGQLIRLKWAVFALPRVRSGISFPFVCAFFKRAQSTFVPCELFVCEFSFMIFYVHFKSSYILFWTYVKL